METLIFAIRFLALSQLIYFLLAIAFSRNPVRVKCTGISLVIGGIAYLLAPVALVESHMVVAAILWTMASLVPCAILLLTRVVFDERRTVPVWMLTLITLDVIAEVATHVSWVLFGELPPEIHRLCVAKRLAILLVAMFLLWKGRDFDLVELRVKLRWWLIGSISLVAFLIDFSHIVTSYDVPHIVELPSLLVVFSLTLAINLLFLRYNPRFVLVGEPLSLKQETQDAETKQMLTRMVKERLYADHDLRIGKLASKLGMPEYQLRKKINRNLGYRNFNQFVNRYRVEEAGEQLKNNIKLPVLTVALDVGFRSISSFNAAFQNHFGVSPTAFRKSMDNRLG